MLDNSDTNQRSWTHRSSSIVWAVDPEQTFYSVAAVDQLLSDTLVARRFMTALLTLFGLAALALAGVGIYGVIAAATGQRTREIGLRLAMGAQPRDMVRMVVGGALGLAGAGVATSLLATLLASRALVSLLFAKSRRPTSPRWRACPSCCCWWPPRLRACPRAGRPAWTLSPLYLSSSSLASSSSAAQ